MRALLGGLGPDRQLRQTDVPAMRLGAACVLIAAALNRADLDVIEGIHSLAQVGTVGFAGPKHRAEDSKRVHAFD